MYLLLLYLIIATIMLIPFVKLLVESIIKRICLLKGLCSKENLTNKNLNPSFAENKLLWSSCYGCTSKIVYLLLLKNLINRGFQQPERNLLNQ